MQAKRQNKKSSSERKMLPDSAFRNVDKIDAHYKCVHLYCKKEKMRCANCPPQVWWTRRDSNPRLLQCECSTLPTELRALIWRKCADNKFSILLIKCFVNQAETSAERGRTGVFCSFNLFCRKTHFTSSGCFISQLK